MYLSMLEFKLIYVTKPPMNATWVLFIEAEWRIYA